MNSAAYITCPRRGKIVGVTWLVAVDNTDNASYWQGELSFASVGQQDVNDPIGVISGASYYGNVVVTANGTSLSNDQINFHDGPMEIAVLPGDRIIYNAFESGTATYYVRILVEIDEN